MLGEPLSFGKGGNTQQRISEATRRENIIHLLPFDLIWCKRMNMKKVGS